jgi:hypothetical protein
MEVHRVVRCWGSHIFWTVACRWRWNPEIHWKMERWRSGVGSSVRVARNVLWWTARPSIITVQPPCLKSRVRLRRTRRQLWDASRSYPGSDFRKGSISGVSASRPWGLFLNCICSLIQNNLKMGLIIWFRDEIWKGLIRSLSCYCRMPAFPHTKYCETQDSNTLYTWYGARKDGLFVWGKNMLFEFLKPNWPP